MSGSHVGLMPSPVRKDHILAAGAPRDLSGFSPNVSVSGDDSRSLQRDWTEVAPSIAPPAYDE
ncbi:hypothetical protein K443DRAFT_674330 [Laccaria amethystina LaAM-08-1]|uniref:Uncharacterized protein n=1 Tax=Laccaria amethystina LaAM-08-1 TaxID=1095629 RepID=A0A0C9X2I8_9AGAR|nr:hypothetical protein K443DRAFT_674330 [Laccaria amethystina LaAM-08-1]